MQDQGDFTASVVARLPGPLGGGCRIVSAFLDEDGSVIVGVSGTRGTVIYRFTMTALHDYLDEPPPLADSADGAALEVAILLQEIYLTSAHFDGSTVDLLSLL